MVMMSGTLRVMTAAIAILAASVHADDSAAAAAVSWPTEIREGVFSFFPAEAGEEDPDDGPGRRSLRRDLATSSSDKNEVKNGLESKCDVLLWGKEVYQSSDDSKLIGDDALSYFNDDANAMRQWLIRWTELKSYDSTADIVRFLVRNGVFQLSSGKLSGGVATYSDWTSHCRYCLKGDFVGNSCDKCGSWTEPKPAKHQPYICLTYTPGTITTPKLIKFVGTYDLCMDYNANGGHNVYMYKCHERANQKWYLTSTGLLKTPDNHNRCADMDMRSENGKNIYLGDCHGGENQQWTFTRGRIRNLAKPDYCLDMHLETRNLYVHNCHDGYNQFFRWA